MQTFIDCILGQKVDKIEKALTWIQSNAHVSFPIVPDDVLMLDANRTKEMMEPVKQAALGNGTDEGDHQGILQRLTGAYINSLKKERIFYVLLILAYVLLVLIGLVVVAFASSMPLSSRLSRRFRRLKLAPPSPYLEKGTLPHPQEDADAGMHRFCNAAPAENCAPDLPAPIFNLRRHRKQFSSASSNRSSTYDGLISAPLPVDIWQQHTASKSWESLLDERHLAQDQAQKAEKPLSAAQADFKKQPRWVFPSASTFWVSLRPWVGREKYDAKEKRSSLVRPLQQSFAMLLSMPIRRALQWWFVPNSAPAPIMQPVVPLVPHNDQGPAPQEPLSKRRRSNLRIDTKRASSMGTGASSGRKFDIISTPSPRPSRREHRVPAFMHLERAGGSAHSMSRSEEREVLGDFPPRPLPQPPAPSSSAARVAPNYQAWPYHPPSKIRANRHGLASLSLSTSTTERPFEAIEEETLY